MSGPSSTLACREIKRLWRYLPKDEQERADHSGLLRADGLRAVVEACDSVAAVEPCIKELFHDGDRAGRVVLSTVHRAKGDEASRVWFLDCPLRKPRRDWEQQQRDNLYYVALTRS